MAKTKAGKSKGMTKSAVYQELAEKAGVTRKQVAAIFEALGAMIKRHLKKKDDTFTIPGMFKLRLKVQKADPGGKTVPNPFRPGEMMVTKPKEERKRIRAISLKALQSMVQ